MKTPDLVDPTDLISTQAGTAALLNGTDVLLTTDGGHTDAQVSPPMLPAGYAPQSVAVTSFRSLALLCVGQGAAGSTEKVLYSSSDDGQHWVKAGAPSREGDPVTLAGGSPTNLVLGTASGASWLNRSANGGRRWTTALTSGDGGVGWADLGFTTVSNAVVVHGPADNAGDSDGRPGQLLLSSDGGAIWKTASF